MESRHSVQSTSVSYGGIGEIQKDVPNSRFSKRGIGNDRISGGDVTFGRRKKNPRLSYSGGERPKKTKEYVLKKSDKTKEDKPVAKKSKGPRGGGAHLPH